MLSRSDGQKSASFTFAAITFAITNLWLLLSIFENLGPLHIRPFDPSGAAVFLSPILLLYFGRRYTEAAMSESDDNSAVPAPPTGETTQK